MINRIGHGFDVHAFCEDRPLIIGGVKIDYHLGLAGHSDADVLLHAIADACLGAGGLGDLGEHFPDHDPQFANMDSSIILQTCYQKVLQLGFSVSNIDCTVVAQVPRLSAYKLQMREAIAHCLNVELTQVNVKATTTERLGFTGREEGIAAFAVVLLEQKAIS
jgi:2-C-methyl-D-erythritol 2,4-cyclodiphosphate synthase